MEPIKPLSPDALYRICDLSTIPFTTTADLPTDTEHIGQERAVEAIEFGIGIQRGGFNLFLLGSTGLGKRALIEKLLEDYDNGRPADDWCYAVDFADLNRPRALRLPAGRGRQLRSDMEHLVEDLLEAIPSVLRSDQCKQRAEAIRTEYKQREDETAGVIAEKAKAQGIALIHTPNGFTLTPAKDDHILTPEEFHALPEELRKSIGDLIDELRGELQQTLSLVPKWHREMRHRLRDLNRDITEQAVRIAMADLEKSYADLPRVVDYLGSLRHHLTDHWDLFQRSDSDDDQPRCASDPVFTPYRINLLVDNAERQCTPVIHEGNPTYPNLIGRLEHTARMGMLTTDFTLIKPGDLHRANGGVLILDALHLVSNPLVWEALKQSLRRGNIRIEPMERQLGFASAQSLEPEPIPLDLKLVLVGERQLYYLLDAYDPDFHLLFKVAADFAEDVPRQPDGDHQYALLIAALQRKLELLPLTREAVERVIEHAARIAGDADRLTVHKESLSNLLQEADHFAGRHKADHIDRHCIDEAIAAARRRLNQLCERIQQEILRGTLLVDTQGIQLGRLNGLSVVEIGDFTFGIPTRISATARVGSGEVVDIQREIQQGGPAHTKGVFILSAYLGRRYARLRPLCLSATLVFEQTYGLVEGDSASAAELCTLLSAVGDVPLNQSLAVTGSVNQHGEMQAIGGVNEKIEGFFDICAARNLNGRQGVIIPASNCKHLMLKSAVRDAVTAGTFHIYAVDHVDQVMELLTGQTSGVQDGEGNYPPDSINGQVQQRLHRFAEAHRAHLSEETSG